MAKHYIILDDQKRILRGFSTDFEQPPDGAVCINEDGGRHFVLYGVENPSMTDWYGVPLYTFDGAKVLARSAAEIEADKPVIVVVPSLDERLAEVEALVKGTPTYVELLEAVNLLLEA